MKQWLMMCLAVFTMGTVAAQIPEVKKKKECYERYDAQGNVIPPSQRRYAEWECGKLAGVVDCNEKLEFDEGSGIMYSGNYGKPFTGTCETCHMNGTIHHRVSFVNGRENGVDTTYYASGCPQVVRNHVQGVENGTWIYYYDSTQFMAWEMNYQLGEKHGKHIFFTADGDTTRWENYNSGLLHGTKRTYYPGTKIKTEVNYNNGVLDGPFKVYNMEGVIIEELIYKQGKKNETAKYYYDDGTLLRTETWEMDVKNGEFKTFYYDGKVQNSESYKKGIPFGWFQDYYPDGVLKKRVLYDKKGERIEEHQYDEQGRETYAFGAPDQNGAEDDAMPNTGGKKKKKKKKKKQE